ncbi:MAG TPA: hypothetical protein VHB50_19490 [Bryobacteraceae bacterium]|nr:hypothetical protein [Bryobacteraceae bacterium]
MGCHHAGEVAPFSLLTYADAKPRAKLIAEAARTRLMPPWKPVEGFGHFAGERRLTLAEIQVIQKWAAAGAPEGNPKNAPPAPVFKADWQLGKPDLVIELPSPMEIPPDGPDLYECFVVPMNVPRNRYIRAVEFRPSNRRVVHHALLFTDASHLARQPRYSCFGTIGLLPTLGIGGWSPGNEAIRMLDGAALPLQANSRLVAQVHYHPDGKPEQDRWRVGFYFTDEPPTRRVVDVGLASRSIDIPPGDAHYVVRQHFTIPIAVDAVGIIPHAHLLCREMRGWAVLPDGRKRWLLNIRDWDFNWQDQYRYATPIRLPADTRIEMEFVYDNSAANPRNPHSPPQRVQWGPNTDDEMAGLHVQSIPVHMEELPELGRALWGAVMRSVGGGFYQSVPKSGSN